MTDKQDSMDKKKTPKTQGLETVPEENLNNSAEDKKPIQSGNDLATWLQNRLCLPHDSKLRSFCPATASPPYRTSSRWQDDVVRDVCTARMEEYYIPVATARIGLRPAYLEEFVPLEKVPFIRRRNLIRLGIWRWPPSSPAVSPWLLLPLPKAGWLLPRKTWRREP